MIFKCLHSHIDELCPIKIIMFKVKLLIKAQLPLWILTHTVGSAILDDPRVLSFRLCNQDSLILSFHSQPPAPQPSLHAAPRDDPGGPLQILPLSATYNLHIQNISRVPIVHSSSSSALWVPWRIL